MADQLLWLPWKGNKRDIRKMTSNERQRKEEKIRKTVQRCHWWWLRETQDEVEVDDGEDNGKEVIADVRTGDGKDSGEGVDSEEGWITEEEDKAQYS